MTTSELVVGIDVAKAELVVAVRPGGEGWSVRNDEVGRGRLRERLQRLAPTLVVLEATGGYERAAVSALAAVRLPVVVVNAACGWPDRMPARVALKAAVFPMVN